MTRPILGVLCGLAALLAVAILVVTLDWGKKTVSAEQVAEILDNLASAANEMKGQELGPNILIDGAWVNDGKYLNYRYKIPLSITEIDKTVAAQKSAAIIAQVCRDRTMRAAFEGGAQISYSYRNTDGQELLVIHVDQEICEK